MDNDDLPMRKKTDYLDLASVCVSFGAFIFKDQEYTQHRDLSMGSPLSVVMASLYMETLEEDKLRHMMERGCEWFYYVNDVLVVLLEGSNVDNKLRMINSVDENIQFTVELEVDHKLPFFDTKIHRRIKEGRFSVYKKLTNKEDFIHYLSKQSARTRSGVVIDFYLRVIRICSEEILEEEMVYITSTFRR
ncbi:uncharacterized protein LOC143037827 [Oratosquilla oratoria]|uniref:uncharacterized protein LOC143037827 n=1 Tax=Oratosquilla oratoria TaxID=337810 RepID=UPI003F7782E7